MTKLKPIELMDVFYVILEDNEETEAKLIRMKAKLISQGYSEESVADAEEWAKSIFYKYNYKN